MQRVQSWNCEISLRLAQAPSWSVLMDSPPRVRMAWRLRLFMSGEGTSAIFFLRDPRGLVVAAHDSRKHLLLQRWHLMKHIPLFQTIWELMAHLGWSYKPWNQLKFWTYFLQEESLEISGVCKGFQSREAQHVHHFIGCPSSGISLECRLVHCLSD